MFRTPVYYNNFNLSTLDGIAIYNHNFIDMPKRVLNHAKLARADRSVLTSAEYSEKIVTIQGIASKGTKTDTELAFETLKGVLQIPEGTLRVEVAGSQVEYIGTLNGISKEYFGNKLKFTLSFLCSNPIGSDRTVSTLLDVTNTLATQTWPLTVQGSFKARPNIKVTFTSVTGATTKTVQVLNADSGQGISITRTFANGDILDVDVKNNTVTYNGTAQAYDGVFPTFFPGNRTFQYIDDFTARDVAILVTYNKQFA
jgi:hypothetical protein